MKEAITNHTELRNKRVKKRVALVERELTNESYKRMIRRYEDVFDTSLGDFMNKLREDSRFHSHLSNLCIRLDFNGFISQHCQVPEL